MLSNVLINCTGNIWKIEETFRFYVDDRLGRTCVWDERRRPVGQNVRSCKFGAFFCQRSTSTSVSWELQWRAEVLHVLCFIKSGVLKTFQQKCSSILYNIDILVVFVQWIHWKWNQVRMLFLHIKNVSMLIIVNEWNSYLEFISTVEHEMILNFN